MLFDALLDNVSDVLECGSVLFEHVVAESYVVRQLWLVTHCLDGCGELLQCLRVLTLLVKNKLVASIDNEAFLALNSPCLS